MDKLKNNLNKKKICHKTVKDQKYQPSSSDENDYYYDYEEASMDDNLENGETLEKPESILSGENSDFGVYICEARNRLDSSSSSPTTGDSPQYTYTSLFYQYDSSVVRRYIKLNPIGPPILKAMQTASQISLDDMITLMMRASPAQINSQHQVY